MNKGLRWIKAGILASLLFSGSVLKGQQEPQYTQFMFNKLPINAGYTGARDVLSFRALYRTQWSGIDGHPMTATLSGHSPIKNENMAVGGFLTYDQLGVTKQTWIDGTYAYRVPLGKKNNMKLSIGINAGMLMYKQNLSELIVSNPGDVSFTENITRILPDVGAGIYFYHEYFYVGASVPNFIPSSLYNKDQIDGLEVGQTAQRYPHLFGMVGGVIPLGKVLKIRPQLMTQNVMSSKTKSPFTMNMNLSFMIYDRVNIGASYRTAIANNKDEEERRNGDSFDALLEVWPTKQLMIGYAYDYTISALKDKRPQTHEIILGYDMQFKKDMIKTPRYF